MMDKMKLYEISPFAEMLDINWPHEVIERKERAVEDIQNALAAVRTGDKTRAALSYVSAYRIMKDIAEETDIEAAWQAMVGVCLEMVSYLEMVESMMDNQDPLDKAIEILENLFKKYKTPYYRGCLVEGEVLVADTIDYENPVNLITRPIAELKQGAVSLGQYDIMENDDGELMFIINPIVYGEKNQSYIFCDGGKHAILFKGPYCVIVCEYMHEVIQKKLPEVKEVLCYEPNKQDDDEKEYMAEVVVFKGTSEIALALLDNINRGK